jgi:hypothetical protein
VASPEAFGGSHPLNAVPSASMEDSVDRYLGRLSSEDLERMVDEMEDLLLHPGMVHVQTLIEVHKRKILYQMVHKPSAEAVVPAHAGGTVKGLEMFEELISAAQKKRDAVRTAILARSRGEG